MHVTHFSCCCCYCHIHTQSTAFGWLKWWENPIESYEICHVVCKNASCTHTWIETFPPSQAITKCIKDASEKLPPGNWYVPHPRALCVWRDQAIHHTYPHNIKTSMHNIRMNQEKEEEQISKYGICVTNLVCKKEIISIVNELQSIWNSISISVSIVTACMHTSGEWKKECATWEYEWVWKQILGEFRIWLFEKGQHVSYNFNFMVWQKIRVCVCIRLHPISSRRKIS